MVGAPQRIVNGWLYGGRSASRALLSARRDAGLKVHRELVVGDALYDPGHEPRRVGVHHLPDAGPELMEDVDSRVATNRRPKVVECPRSGASPIGTVSRGDSD